MPDLKRRRGRHVTAILLAAVAHRLASELICAPRSPAPTRARSYAPISLRASGATGELASARWRRKSGESGRPNVMHPFIDDAFLASNPTVPALQETRRTSEYDEELLFKELRLDAAKDRAILMARGFR